MLARLIPKFFESNDCDCKSYARKMDRWGIAGCEGRFDEIVDHLVKQSSTKPILKHFPTFGRLVAAQWLRMAIGDARAASQKIDNGDWFVAVTTAPRKACTLQECLDSIRDAGWEPTVFAEPGSTLTGSYAITNNQKLGVWHNWLSSARYALENTDAKLILTVQDDALFHPESRSFIESIQWPSDAGLVSLYTAKHYSFTKNGELRQTGINRINTRSFWGSLAIAWKREVLQAVVNSPIAKNWLGAKPKSGNMAVMESRKANPTIIANTDTAHGKIVRSLGLSMYCVDPSPVQHIAVHSTISHGGNTGRRNCYRCADHDKPLASQVFG
jgi:hypothetical protein